MTSSPLSHFQSSDEPIMSGPSPDGASSRPGSHFATVTDRVVEWADAPRPPEMAFSSWLAHFRATWHQGEHVAIIGQTGSGKTSLGRDILSVRDYVVVLAVKRDDDTLVEFPRGVPEFQKISRWPPRKHEWHHVLMVMRPRSLQDAEQRDKVYGVLNGVFKAGGWCIFLDDTGYLTGTLGMKRPITVLLNQGRSSGISVVSVMTQPTSVAQAIPSETLRQVRHVIAFSYKDERDIEAIARITGENTRTMKAYMRLLGEHDFLYFHGWSVTLVRNTRAS